MTNITVTRTALLAENLSWDLSSPNVPYAAGGTLDVAAFTAAQHYPNGFIPSGTILGRISATDALGPYLASATDGRETAVGVLKASIQVVAPTGQTTPKVGCAVYVAHAVVSESHLPLTADNAAAGGYLDDAAKTDLAHIAFVA